MTVPVVRLAIAGEETAQPSLNRAYTVIYDGDCKVCTRLARTLRRWDQRAQLEVIPSQTPGVAARFPWIPARAYRESLQLVSSEGETWQGAAAIEQLLRILPRGRLIGWIFHVPLMRKIADRFYRWFARNRYRLGCGEHCQLRAADLTFIDEAK